MQNIVLQTANGSAPLYQQLYTALVQEMKAGRLHSGEKLPSKRRLAEQLHISLNTVDTAYQMLVAEGYLAAKPRSGFRVRRFDAVIAPSNTAVLSAAPTLAAVHYRYNFETASIDTGLFPFKTWRRLQRDLLVGNPALLNHGHRQGDENLRRAIATHLHEFRGATCTAEQIVVGAGIEYLLGLLARLFCTQRFAVEDPGYARTHRILENSGAGVSFVAVDDSGMTVDGLVRSNAALAYVTPSHQFPTGVTMPVGRRTELLQWANAAPQRYLIEDDYDSEFRFDVKPVPCLQGLDKEGKVIYISTFSKSIAPAIRIGYMVLPPALLARYQAEFGFYSCTVSRFEQQTLCRFMEEGHFARHLNRLRIAYRQRRDALVAALGQVFGKERITILGSHTGLHLLLQLHGELDETQLVERAHAHDVHVNGLSQYYLQHAQGAAPSTIVLGYAALQPKEIESAVQALGKAWLL